MRKVRAGHGGARAQNPSRLHDVLATVRRMQRRKIALILAAGLVVGGLLSPPQCGAKTAAGSAARAAVESTSIASIGYVRASKALEIEFRSGAVYRYASVPATVHAGFMASESKGRYFSQHIRGRYEFVRVKVRAP